MPHGSKFSKVQPCATRNLDRCRARRRPFPRPNERARRRLAQRDNVGKTQFDRNGKLPGGGAFRPLRPPVSIGGKWGFPGWGQGASGTRLIPPTAPLSGTLGNILNYTIAVPIRLMSRFRRETLVSKSLPRPRPVKNPDSCSRGAVQLRSASVQPFDYICSRVAYGRRQWEGSAWQNEQASRRCRCSRRCGTMLHRPPPT